MYSLFDLIQPGKQGQLMENNVVNDNTHQKRAEQDTKKHVIWLLSFLNNFFYLFFIDHFVTMIMLVILCYQPCSE